jgi:hypothetical protein
MATTPEHQAARSGIRKVLAVLVAVGLAFFIGSFFILGS